MWTEVNHWVVPLYPFLKRKALQHMGCDTGQDIYIVQDAQEVVYVGQTVTGVWARLWRHAKTNSKLGLWMIEHEFDTEAPSYHVEVIGVRGDISEAEQHTIAARAPTLNIVSYKTTMAMPPLERVTPTLIDVDDIKYLHSLFNAPRSGTVEQTETYRMGHELYVLDMLYDRAYRDPNHPGLHVDMHSCSAKDVFYYQRVRRLNRHRE